MEHLREKPTDELSGCFLSSGKVPRPERIPMTSISVKNPRGMNRHFNNDSNGGFECLDSDGRGGRRADDDPVDSDATPTGSANDQPLGDSDESDAPADVNLADAGVSWWWQHREPDRGIVPGRAIILQTENDDGPTNNPGRMIISFPDAESCEDYYVNALFDVIDGLDKGFADHGITFHVVGADLIGNPETGYYTGEFIPRDSLVPMRLPRLGFVETENGIVQADEVATPDDEWEDEWNDQGDDETADAEGDDGNEEITRADDDAANTEKEK